jgi:hypothetical protein
VETTHNRGAEQTQPRQIMASTTTEQEKGQ